MSEIKPREWLYVGKTISRLNNVYAIIEPFPHFSEKTWLVEKSAYEQLKDELETERLKIKFGMENAQAWSKEREQLKRERDEWIKKYQSVELANKMLSRNDHKTFGELYLDRDQLRAQAEELVKALEWIEEDGALGDYHYAQEHARQALAAYRKGVRG